MVTIQQLKKSADEFYKKSTKWLPIQTGITRIDTPFLDRHNDAIILYAVSQQNGLIKLTDGGYIFDDLEGDGIYLSRSKQRMHILTEQLNSYSVKIDKSQHELFITTTLNDYPVKQNLLIQAMLFTNDMFMLSNKKVSSIFINEVAKFFEDQNIRVTDGPNIIGRTGMIHHYDFSIPGIRDIPEKLIRTMNNAKNEYYAKSIAMDKRQTQDVRPNTDFYTIINDEESVDDNIINLFDSEGITPILFSKRNNYIEQLAK
ncbi:MULTISPECIES: DUF1828 domain-containing protein [Lactiplantibacillus]|jgi:hypothetical protein|uniref:DUF1828 domain-containing protein n=1 Tax=Lactiplantibacillus argentoratensis TaxID=271881 RepID=A0ABS5UIY6_9LACO|nr:MULTISPECIES: DUF1828 domain-containing protein [Lactiplantibacillus]ARO01191.1 hypothetical protein BIZ31_10175 [Lactiplantibacillus plantarum]ARO04097.1 hypothetical protein BIZ32_09985 [Lactiplantibacillus plantarum]AXQ26960.1 DUF1828 domain-containing protein [Lactiplantibacillus plantarum]EFK29116.1 hypothetical protein HMPREF0531_11815 [Lactiplantibacillus plantarum subsp. plantarum ATCC 14917 = JCM 1149 = CGMCC 1.2437]KPN85189.1 prophage protein [Lactiplantibacillus plantarum]